MFSHLLALFFPKTETISTRFFISLFCILYKFQQRQIPSIELIPAAMLYFLPDRVDPPVPIPPAPKRFRVVNGSQPRVSPPSVTSSSDLQHPRGNNKNRPDNRKSNDGRFVTCMCPLKWTAKTLSPALSMFKCYPNSITFTPTAPGKSGKLVHVTFKTAQEALRFIQARMNVGGFIMKPTHSLSVPTHIFNRFPPDDSSTSEESD
ncbi:hypothetical protein GEMRC1_004005 [Eukaryota sp. GEM-RC1]